MTSDRPQCQPFGYTKPLTWDDYEAQCMATYSGGHRDELSREAFRHGMGTIFNMLRNEFPSPEAIRKNAADNAAGAKAETRTFHCTCSEVTGFKPTKVGHYAIRQIFEHAMTIEAPNDTEASHRFLKMTGLRPDFIDFKEVAGHCESCLRPLYESDDYSSDGDGIYFCPACIDS